MRGIERNCGALGSAGYQPAGFGILPKRTLGGKHHKTTKQTDEVVGRLPTTTGWQPVIPEPVPL